MPIRAANPTDWPHLVALDSTAPHDPRRAIQIRHWIAAGHCHLLAENGQPRAYAVLTRHFFDRPFIEMIMVGAPFRRQGYASTMIGHLASLADGSDIWASTNRSNTGMQRIFALHGFVQRGAIDLDQGDPELIFAASLSSFR